MTAAHVLLETLLNPEEPLEKRLKLANNAFNTTQYQIRRKEGVILRWALSTFTEKQQIDENVIKWISSTGFKQITLNDITNGDIAAIIELLQKKQSIVGVQAVLQLCNNQVFQQFFKYNPKNYCELLASSAQSIDNANEYVDFIKNPLLWSQSVVANEEFTTLFIDYLFPVLVQKTVQFKHDSVYKESAVIIQKVILQGNLKYFTTFLDKLFEGEHEDSTLANSVFKFLAKLQDQDIAVYFKLFYSAFCNCFKDPNYPFKCLLLLTYYLKVDFSVNFNFKLKTYHTPQLSQTLNTILELLDVLSGKNYQDCNIADNISLSDFLRNLIKSLTFLNPTVLEIILKCITINPLIIEPIASNLVVFIMTHNNSKFKNDYEQVIVAIFEVFSKLHRMENFIAKLIPALKSSLVNQTFTSSPVYEIKAEPDLSTAKKLTTYKVHEIFTHTILDYISTCLIGLASWQVINVFKSLLHHFKNCIEEFAEGNFADDSPGLVYMEILGVLTSTLLQSIKIADHTVAQNVVVKFVDGLEELRSVLKDFSAAILKRPHNNITMRTFLGLAYMWAEVYITLTYYSMNKEVVVPTVTDYSGDSLTYLHSYMTRTEWQMVEQRITNFGQSTCTRLLQKLYLQKLHAMLLLDEEVKPEAISNVIKWLPTHLKASWQDFLEDKFAVRVLLKEIDRANLIFLGENLVEHFQTLKRSHLTDSALLTNVTLWVLMGKINKLFRLKRKRDSELGYSLSEKVFKTFPEDAFLTVQSVNFNGAEANELWQDYPSTNIQSKEEKLLSYLERMKLLPFVYSEVQVQQMVLLYLLALTKDVENCSSNVKTQVENLLIGVLQASKWPLIKTINWDILIKHVLPVVNRNELVFSLLIDNTFRHENCLTHQLEPLITHLVGNLSDLNNVHYCITVLQAINKAKKSKLPQTTKDQLNEYKTQIISKMSKLVCKSELVEAYAICLKHYLTEKDNQTDKLLRKLPSYLDYCFSQGASENKKGCAILFNLVLEKRTQIDAIPQDIVSKIWGACKGNQLTQDYTHLVNLIVCSIPNEEFGKLVDDLVQLKEGKQLKTWESVITCDVNPTKMKMLQNGVQRVLNYFQDILTSNCLQETADNIVHLQQCIIQSQHFILSPPIIDTLISTPAILISKPGNFTANFNQAICLLELQLKHRNPIIMDRLPVFLQQYRVLLKTISVKSNQLDMKIAGDCVHRLEKLTKNLVANKKDMSRIAVFLIADILERYEQINLYPNVKLHLNNCIYSLISVCDHHAVAYLMRALSRASTEMFKLMYEHYKKYYMFTGKV